VYGRIEVQAARGLVDRRPNRRLRFDAGLRTGAMLCPPLAQVKISGVTGTIGVRADGGISGVQEAFYDSDIDNAYVKPCHSHAR